MRNDTIVSFDNEPLILVDESDDVVGYESKAACHQGDGRLHRAFSVFLFDESGELLLQQRAPEKLLWPMVWSNSCCSHPRRSEEAVDAAHRRVHEELGVESELTYLYKFTYQASFEDKGSENELCWVFIGRANRPIRPNVHEIHDWKFVSPDELDRDMAAHPDRYTPWLKLEWQQLRSEHWPEIEALWR